MKTNFRVFWLLFFLWIHLGALAHSFPEVKDIKGSQVANKSKEDNKSKETNELENKKNLSTQMSFEDLLIQGTYHFANESVVTIEEDKVLDSLLEVPKDFKDRIKKSAFLY